jgi:hypothetical protein
MFLKIIVTGGFITPIASFHWGFISSTASKNNDLNWLLALTVLKNASKNRFAAVTIELLCTNGERRGLAPNGLLERANVWDVGFAQELDLPLTHAQEDE